MLAALGLPPLLSACGGDGAAGGGATQPTPPPPPPNRPTAPTGLLAYRNNRMAALHDFDAVRDASFEPGGGPPNKIGVGATPAGQLINALNGDDSAVPFATFDRQGRRLDGLRLERPFAVATGLPVFNASGSRAAIALNEPATPGGTDRVDRVRLVTWPVSLELTRFDGWTTPVWAGGQLILRHADTGRLRLFGADLRALGDIGPAAGLAASERVAVGPDPRCLVYSRGNEIRCFDRQSLADTVAARRDTDRLGHPCLSPDGRWLAVHALAGPSATRNVSTTLPHVLPFDPAGAVLVDSAHHALAQPAIVDCGGQMVWLR